MDGILIIDKPKGITSRDVVNFVVKRFNTKKVGHTGTLDPIATGVLVLCVGSATKLVKDLTSSEKEYIASVELGTLTDTLDSTGTIIKTEECIIEEEKIIDVLNSFIGEYMQEVPIYSAVKVNGKKLYEYARNKEKIDLPKRNVSIKSIELIDDIQYKNNKTIFKFKCCVSKGTYIRSLIRDIALKLNTVGIMTDLRRTKQGIFNIEDSIKLEDINLNSLISIKNALNVKCEEIPNNLLKKVLNGATINNTYDTEEILFLKDNKEIALYKGDSNELKPYIMFKGGGNI